MCMGERKRRERKHPRRKLFRKHQKAGPFPHSSERTSSMDDTLYKFRCRTCVCLKAQQGAALLLLLLITVVAASSIFVTTLRQSTTQVTLDKNRKTRDALARAKEALIAYALTYSEQPPTGTPPGSQPQGFLPCPDTDGDGSANPPCGGAGQSFSGMLPWRQLGIPPLRDGDGECLWYAVSGNYKNNPKISLTSDTDGQFIVEDGSGNVVVGATVENQAIAIVFSPGAALGAQDRSSTNPLTRCGSTDTANEADNYLDTFGAINNATGNPALPTTTPSVFVSPAATGPMIPNFNDTLLAVTAQDFEPVYGRMDRWVANRAQQCLTGPPYSWAAALDAPVADPPDNVDDANQRFGRIPTNPTFGLPPWGTDPDLNVGGICFQDVAGWTGPGWWWWDRWREMVFYAVDAASSPGGGISALQLTGAPVPSSQFVIAAAGRKLAGQQRSNATQKADISNYLEDHNNPLFPSPPSPALSGPGNIPTGDEQFVTTPTVAGTAFNDTLCNDAGCP